MTTAISAALVKELRELTGAGMMDCKRALVETGGDIEAAQKLLREKGLGQAAKRADRETTEGKVGYTLADDGKKGTIVAVGCETEPVSNNEEFLSFAEKTLKLVDAEGKDAVEQVEDERIELVAKLGENIRIVGAARFVAMHIAAAAPQWVSREDVPEDLVMTEREIYANSDEVKSKPEQAREKIVEGMLNKRFFAAQVLTEQPWIHDTAKTVGQALSDAGAEVLEFERLAVSG